MRDAPRDYVIVGAGSAGCVLARRLSDDPRTSVLLIEAGPEDRSWLLRVPRGYLWTHRDPRLAWHFPLSAEGGEWPGSLLAGKVLGGTSSINSMLYVRGQPQDYDDWARSGAPGWSWRDLAPCFKQIEDHQLGESATRGVGGPLPISCPRDAGPVCEAVIRSGVALGLPRREDLNGLDQEGIGYFPVTIDGGRRMSAARAFLDPVRRRPNLTVVTDTAVTRILFEGRRAVGIACEGRGPRRELRTGREVLLCAGALQSPKLLQLSGIGPAAHLRSLGIPVVADSPGVGANLRDHWGLRLHYELLRVAGHNRRLRGAGLWLSALRYLVSRRGALASAAAEVGAFVRAVPGATRADAELQISPFSVVPGTGRVDAQPGLMCTVRSLRPESQGSVLLRSADPAAPPVIRGNFLSAESDRLLTVHMVGYARRLLRQPPLAGYLGREIFPGPGCRSEEDIVETCRRSGSPGSHFAGTCRMGEDRLAVVDPALRVRGVSGLRVVDCSIMPTLVSGNTNGPVLAMAWRAADLILAEAAGR